MITRSKRIIKEVEAEFELPIGTLSSKGRTGYIVKAKKECVRRLRAVGFSYPEIGQAMGCNHTTAMWHFKNKSL